MFPCKFDFPQFKQKLTSSIKNRMTDLEKFGHEREISKLDGD